MVVMGVLPSIRVGLGFPAATQRPMGTRGSHPAPKLPEVGLGDAASTQNPTGTTRTQPASQNPSGIPHPTTWDGVWGDPTSTQLPWCVYKGSHPAPIALGWDLGAPPSTQPPMGAPRTQPPPGAPSGPSPHHRGTLGSCFFIGVGQHPTRAHKLVGIPTVTPKPQRASEDPTQHPTHGDGI